MRYHPFALLLLLLTACLRLSAATITWTGAGPDRNASTPANWNTNKAPAPEDDIVIDAADHLISWDAFAPAVHSLTLGGKFSGTVTVAGPLKTSGDITIQSGVLATAKDVAVEIVCDGCLQIGKAGKMILRRSSVNDLGAGQKINAGEIKIEGVMSADFEGFDGMKGLSPGIWGMGASHGGQGNNAREAAHTYGSMENPTSLGSGGFGSACGGGAIVLICRGKITVNGVLSADGQVSGGGDAQSGGAGGSINLTAALLSGKGVIRAKGGNAIDNTSWHTAAGGGRIGLNGVARDEFTGALDANGGTGIGAGGHGKAFSGTIYLSAPDRQNLVIGGESHLKKLRLGSDDTNNYAFGAVTIKKDGVLEIDGNPRRNKTEGYGSAAALLINTLEIQEDGRLSADGLGYSFNGFGFGAYAQGGSYGGECGHGNGKSNDCYGSVTNPIELGSPGCGEGACGGGAVILVVKDKLQIDGRISANGLNGQPLDGTGGGSGGTINIAAPSIAGKGALTVNGGLAGGGNTSGGGGGRIGIVLSAGTTLDALTIQAAGGADPALKERSGAAGTVFIKKAGEAKGRLIVDNLGAPSRGSTFLNGAYVHDTDVESVLLRNGARLRFSPPFPAFVAFEQK